MKKLLVLLLTVILLTGCEEFEKQDKLMASTVPKVSKSVSKPVSKQKPINGYFISTFSTLGFNSNNYTSHTIVNDDCEYIIGWLGSFDGGPILTHKGNCKNPIHKQIIVLDNCLYSVEWRKGHDIFTLKHRLECINPKHRK